VKNVGENANRAIIEEREKEGPFKSLFDFCARVDLRTVNKRVVESLVKCGAFDAEGIKRSQLFAATDSALEQGQATQRDKEMGQTQLFDMLGEEESSGPVIYPVAEDWPDSSQLKYEKEVLGLFISGHPLTKHSDKMRALTTTDSEGLQQLKEGDSVVIGGIVSKIKTIVPKRRKERMAFVTIEDTDGFFEMVVFSDLYSQTSMLLHEDSLIMAAGSVSYKDSEPKVLAENIVPIEEAEENFARASHVKLMTTGLEDSTLEELARIVSANEGRCKLFIHCITPDTKEIIVESAVNKGLNPSPMVKEQIEALVGKGAVWFSLRNDACLSSGRSGLDD
jgi:DNA polymerase-3 subunit alpha